MAILNKDEIAKRLRTDPRQRFYLTNVECKIIVNIIVDIFKEALLEGRLISLPGFAKIFFSIRRGGSLWNYSTRSRVTFPFAFQARLKLDKKLNAEAKRRLKENHLASINEENTDE